MNKKCKRIISSVLSFTMILGCMVFNDVGVIQAAETKIAEYDFNTGDSGYLSAPAGIVNITGTTVTTGEVDETADLTVNESGGSQDAHGFRLNGGNSIILRNIRGASDETVPVKVTIGGCSWGSTFTVTDGDSFEKSGLTNKIGGCWHSNKTANVFNIYYNGEKSVLKMTAAGQIYIPYLKVSTVSEEEYKAAIIPSSVTLSGTDTIAVGSETQLSAALAPTNVYPFIDTLKWSSSDETVAEVNENGVVTGKGIGSTEITAVSSENADIKGTMTVNVVDPNTKYVVKGEISGVASDKVTSVKIGDTDAVIDEASFTYTAEVVPGKYTVSANAVDGYTLSSLSTAELTVSGDTTRNIHYKKNVVAATDTTVYVDGSENGANHYDTITQAVAGLKAGNKTSGATVVLTAGEIYEEQVIVDVPKVKFYCEDSTNLPTVQWYYGIGQTYYSADSTGYYNEERAYDKTQKGKVDRWGCAVRVTASGFSAENVIFKNTFNYNVTQAELDDGVTRDASAYGENTGGIARTDLKQNVQTTAATERAAAIALDGSNAAFENCQFLGSQDTIYSGGNAYFKNCLIAGQTDYMFNNSGTVIVDDSVLQWKGYSGTPKAGYITAARGKYIFRNCEITKSDTLSVTPGYYGRPWGTSADVSFIGCKTNGLIVDAGWTSMSGVAPDASMFKENSNTTDGTKAFNSALNAADSEIGTDNDPKEDYKYFKETWVPFNHVAYKSSESGSTVTATWDFQNGSPESIKDTNIQGVDANGTVASDVDGVSLGVEAAETGTNIKLQYNASGYAQFNQNTLIKVPVKTTEDVVTVVSYPGQYKYTVGGTAASANETVYTATADDVAQGYVAVVATGTAYLYSITLVTNEAEETPEPSKTVTATWDFQNGSPESIKDTNIQGVDANGTVASDVDGVSLGVEAAEAGTNIKLQYNASGYAQFNQNTLIKVPVKTTSDTVTVVSYPGQYKYTVGGTAASADETVYTATADDVAQGYVAVVATGTAYLYSITLVTNEAEETPEPSKTVTATWDFQNGSPESIKDTNIQGVDANGTVASDVDGVSLGVEAAETGTNIKLQYNASGYAQFNQNTLIKVPVKTTEDVVTVVSYPGQYKYTVGGTAASADETVYTATADDVAQGYVAIVATSTAYLYSITLVTNEAGSSIVLGDVNKDGVIDADDAAAIIRLVATLSGDYDTDAADADGNGNIELLDAIFYLQNLPVTTA